jgi:DNA-directed RNA polymerase specialized sigma24 family protein
MERHVEGSGRPIVTAEKTAADVACAVHSLSDADLVRLNALARLWAKGLPRGLNCSDVLHEAIARVLDGSRKWPEGVPILAFLSGVMRSICDDYWRRERLESCVLARDADLEALGAAGGEAGSIADPERVLGAAQSLAAVNRLFVSDPLALKIIAGLTDGLTAAEICKTYGMSEREYDTGRKRMRRTLLRHGLDWRTT